MYTPLILNPVSTAGSYFSGNLSTDYFINLTSIKINGKPVPLNAALLNITDGNGGTKISTVKPYTVMETSIFKAFVKLFGHEANNLTKVSSVKPFKYCFSSKNTPSTRAGPAVPIIDLVMNSRSVYWRIFGANSMVQVKEDVMCLGFVDGGSNLTTSITIGGYQLEDNLVQIDLEKARLGFSSSLLFKRTTCSNFNFSSSA
ncbi:Peptidase A1 domain-containing protein [Psidium guajava]|nr:Peptidase A1 domain-containing protein [Psidium guajava]